MAIAPTSKIETVTIVRPLKVIAAVCGGISILLLIISIASTAWLEADNYRQGLWEECDTLENGDVECRQNETTDWIIACASLAIIALFVDLVATILTGIGLNTSHPERKFIFYRAAMYLMFFAVLLMIIALIVFPVMFMQEIKDRKKPEWFFGWAYGIGWGATIFLFGACILLLVDKESEEIFYREKTYYSHEETDA